MNNKVCIITGASSGIGKALAYEYASQGYQISISARREDLLRAIATDIKSKYSTDVLIVKADVSKEEDCKQIIDQTVEQFGKIDILINNAGISQRALLADLPLDSLREVMGVNYWGT
ncbi:MAG: short-chain dehydrogenase, partial [Bacteroidetes bacterium]